MQAFRIVKERYVHSCLDGAGARLAGGRWNHKGHPMVYAGWSISLCLLETLIHLSYFELANLSFRTVELFIPDELVENLDRTALPADWTSCENIICKQLGSSWLDERRSVGLQVPSVVVPAENNILLNPNHPGFRAVQVRNVQPVAFDPRLATKRA